MAFTSASCKFLKEVHSGDTLYPELEIIALTPQGDTGIVTTRATVHDQRGELILEGERQYALRSSSEAGKCKYSFMSAGVKVAEQVAIRQRWPGSSATS